MIQNKTNAERDGTITKIEMNEPFRIISFMVSLSVFFSSDNNSAIAYDNKNQRYVISFCLPLNSEFSGSLIF